MVVDESPVSNGVPTSARPGGDFAKRPATQLSTGPGHTTPAEKQPRCRDLVICSAPRGALSCAWPRRGPVRAAASLAAAPVPPVARAERSWAIGPKPQTISTLEK